MYYALRMKRLPSNPYGSLDRRSMPWISLLFMKALTRANSIAVSLDGMITDPLH